MRISQLRCFVTTAQLENMTQAAELLHLSQSSLSKNIAALEEEVGTELFQRSGRRLTLNPAGERLLEYSNMALRELDYALEDMRLLSAGEESRIRIGTAGFSDRLAGCLAAFKKEAPQAEFELAGNIESFERLDISEYDMLIYPDTHKYEKFTGMALYEEKYFLAVPEGCALAGNQVVRAPMLAGQDIIFLRSGRAGEEFPYQICRALAIRFASVCFADTRELHRRMITAGLGAGFVPASAASSYREDGLCLIPVQDQRFNRRMMICFRRDKYLSPLAKQFRDFVLDYFAVEKNT